MDCMAGRSLAEDACLTTNCPAAAMAMPPIVKMPVSFGRACTLHPFAGCKEAVD